MTVTLQGGYHGRVAVVTGGSRGIGRAIAKVAGGAEVHICDRAAAADLPGTVFHEVDISDGKAITAMVADLLPVADLLVNNAGITRDRSIVRMSDEEWQSVLNVDLTGAFNLIRAIAPGMMAAGYGRIVNVVLINGLRGKFSQATSSPPRPA